jgi:hypothetical protein
VRRATQGAGDFSRHESTNGFVLDVGETLVVVQQFHDFYEEGCCVLRLKDVVEVRSDEHERFWERMYEREGIRRRDAAPYGIRATTMSDVLRRCREAQAGVIVQREEKDAGDDVYFDVGVVEDVDDLRLQVRAFDAFGAWDERETMRIVDVTCVQIDTPYVTTYLRHAQPRPTDD